MLFRALVSFLILPAVMAGLIPWLLLASNDWRIQSTGLGWPILLFGIVIVMWCTYDFYVIGKGTLAPWDPPKNLVITGPYRFMRNPMYAGILLWLVGWSLISGAPLLAAYIVVLAIGFHLRVIFYEEPILSRKYGNRWTEYCCAVNRWLPKL